MTGAVSKAKFAEILGVSRSYVSQLVAAKRVVMSEDHLQILVDPSLELLGATSDPSKAGVRERWAAMRAAAGAPQPAQTAPAAAQIAPPAADQPAAATSAPVADDSTAGAAPSAAAQTPARSEYQDARTLREKAEAEMAQMKLRQQLGQLLDADSTLRAIADAHTAARSEVLALPDRLAQVVAAEVDPRKVWELINAECELACTRMAEKARKMIPATAEVMA